MAKIVIEIFKATGFRRDFKVFDRLPLTIGRGYQNDLIVFDPYVSAEHIRIKETVEGWVVEDLDSTNGTQVNHQPMPFKEQLIKSGDEITIGQTRLCIVSSSHPVAGTLALTPTNVFFKNLDSPLVSLGLIFLVVLGSMLIEYLSSTKNMPAENLILGAFFVLILMVMYSGIWAFIGRLIKHKAQFCAQLSFNALIFLASVFIAEPIVSYAGYLTSSLSVAHILSFIVFGLLFSLQLMGGLAISTYLAKGKRTVVSLIIGVAIIIFGVLSTIVVRKEFINQPDFNPAIRPMVYALIPSIPADEFIQNSQTIFAVKEEKQ